MSTSPKIGYLIPEFPGQTHIFFWREIEALERMGISVSLFSTRRPPAGLISHKWSEDAIARTEYLGVIDAKAAAKTALSVSPTIYAKDILSEGKQLAKDLAVTTGAAQLLKQSCTRQGISHVHVHSCGRAALVAVMAYLMGGPSYSVTLHGDIDGYGAGQRLKWRHAKFATVVSEQLNGQLDQVLGPDRPSRVFVQPMGVDLNALRRDRPYQPYPPGEALRLFSCGRLNIAKGHQDLIDSVKLLRDKGIDARLTIAGEDDQGGGGFRKVLEEKITELELDNAVTLLGAVSAEDVRQQLNDAHLFVLATHQEAIGVAYMEAMACEVPTIGTRVGGVPELIHHGVDGVLVEPHAPNDLAAAIQLVANSPQDAMRYGKSARSRIEERFDCRKGAELIARESLDLTISKEI